MPPFSTKSASWIWTDERDCAVAPLRSPSHYQVRFFRRDISCEGIASEIDHRLYVSADTRFLLYWNGELLGRGPCPGDVHHQYYETFSIPAAWVREKNTIAAAVFDYSPVHCNPPFIGAPAAYPTHSGGLLVELHRDGEPIAGTDGRWKVHVDTAYHFQAEGKLFGAFVGYFEDLHLASVPEGWTLPEFDDSLWAHATSLYPATRLEDCEDTNGPYGLIEHQAERPAEKPIARGERERAFLPGSGEASEGWLAFWLANEPLEIPAHTRTSVILPCRRQWTAFPRLACSGGGGSTLKLRYAEALRLPRNHPDAVVFGAERSVVDVATGLDDDTMGWTFDPRGELSGYCDIVRPDGRSFTYEPHHFRTFKFIQIEVETVGSPLFVSSLDLMATGYPLKDEAEFVCSENTLNAIYEVSWHTLRLSTHETFTDCPYYEQLQYLTDGFLSMLSSLVGAGEAKLGRQFIEQAAWSLNHEGLLWDRYPSRLPGFIPGQCLDWIFALREYSLSTGDLEVARSHRHHMHSLLGFFQKHTGGYGLPENLPWWNWIDWCPGWKRGVPPGTDAGPTLSLSAKYAMALGQAAEVSRWLGDDEAASSYGLRQEKTLAAINRIFWNSETGRYCENIVDRHYASQLGNAFAVLAGAPAADRYSALRSAFEEDSMTPASYMGMFFIRLARAELGIYSLDHLLDPYREMIDYGLSTWAEDTCYWRSLCHGYSAHPIVDCITLLLGIRVLTPGATTVRIAPMFDALPSACGGLPTPHGLLSVAWSTETDGTITATMDVPDGVTATFMDKSGVTRQLPGGKSTRMVPAEIPERVLQHIG